MFVRVARHGCLMVKHTWKQIKAIFNLTQQVKSEKCMPCDYKKYHPAWKQIVIAIKKRAKDHCELCGVPNHCWIFRYKGYSDWFECCECDKEILEKSKPGKVIRVILTVAHIDQDVTNNKPWNLLALCQRCHNKIDLPYRIKHRKEIKNV